MPNLLHPHFISFHSQNSIQSHDVLTISALAKTEGLTDDINTYSFDDFLGLAIYLFVTTQSQQTREQLSLHLSKFGSAAVLPLVKILCRIRLHKSVRQLAQQSLDNMELYPLIIGLSHVLDREVDDALRTTAIQALIRITQEHNQSVLLLLPKLVSQKTWRIVKSKLLAVSPYPRFNHACSDADNSFEPHSLPKYRQQISNLDGRKVILCEIT